MRKKVRKSLAFLLALALVVSVMSGLGLSVSADDAQNESVVTETEGEPAEEKPKAEESTSEKEEKDAEPAVEPVQKETKDEKKTAGEEGSEKAAENKAAETPKAGENVQTATIGTGDKTVTVKTTAAAGVLPEGAKLVVKKLANQDQAYQDAESTLRDSQVTYDDFLALDVSFEVNGKEVEPEAGSVQVQFELGAGLLPETADTSTLAVQHLTDGKAETVADAGAVTAGDVTVKNQVVKADFEVQSFSSFTITWSTQYEYYLDTHFKATVKYVDEGGNEINTGKEANVSATGNQTLDIKKEYGHDISGYSYLTARYQNAKTGSEITQIKTTETINERKVTRTVKLIMSTGGEIIVKSNERPIIYLVYTQNTSGGHTGPSQTLAHEKYVTDNGDHTYDLNLTVSGKKGSKTSKAKVDVLFILDRSGSMRFGMNNSNQDADAPNRRIDKVADAVNTLTTNLKDNENIDARYSVVSFADTATTDQNWTSSAGAAYAAVAKATPYEGTNYQAGIYQAKEQLKSSRSGAQTMVIFLTDGAPTYQGREPTSGCGSGTHQVYIDSAKTELGGMTADGFYCVGVMLDSSIDVYSSGAHKNNLYNYHGDDFKKMTGKAILQEIIDGGTNIKGKPAPMMANDPKALNDAFDKIEAEITDLLCNNVIVTDVLSENVKMVTKSETDTTPKKLVVTIKKNADGSIVQDPATIVNDGEYEIKAEYNAATKQITLKFDPDYTLNPDYTYIVTATIEATEKAYENVRANKGVYPDIGDAGTGETSAGESGVYSNENGEAEAKAKVSYVYNESKKTEYYNKPVIQLEPAHLTIKKTITGLTKEQIDAALKDKLTFNITYTYLDETTGTAAVKLDAVTAGENGEYTFTYTSGDIWSMGATYEVTETGYDAVTDYVCNPTSTDAKGSIPKYSTATASFTNTYTKATQDLTITKVIKNLSPDAKFKLDNKKTYTFAVTADASVDVAGKTYTIEGSKESKVSFKGQEATVTIQGEGSIVIKGLPVGGYTVKEQTPENVTGYDFKGADYSTAGGKTTLTSNAPGTVTVTNKYEIKKIAVNVKKELTGNMYNSGDKFSFTATNVDGTFKLGNNETREITVNYGDEFVVTEADNDKGYTLESIAVASGGDTGTSDGSKYTIDSVTKSTTIIFTNKKQINPPNGIITTIAPYAIMVVLAAGAGVYFVYSRRRRNH